MTPDGYVYVTYRELALDGETNKYEERPNGRRFNFCDIRFWKLQPHGVHIATPTSTTIIPWGVIEEIDVQHNSPEYVEWYKREHDLGPVVKFAHDQQREF